MVNYHSIYGGEIMSEQPKIKLKLGNRKDYLLTQKCSLHG